MDSGGRVVVEGRLIAFVQRPLHGRGKGPGASGAR